MAQKARKSATVNTAYGPRRGLAASSRPSSTCISCVITILTTIVHVTFLVLARQPALLPSPAPAPALPRGRGLAWPLLPVSGLEKAQPAPAATSASMEKVRITHRHPYLPGGQ